MGILVINLGKKIGWAIHRKEGVTKTITGSYTIRNCKVESENKQFERLSNFIQDLLNNYGQIHTIFYEGSDDANYKLYKHCVRVIKEICIKNDCLYSKLSTKQVLKKVLNVKNYDKEKTIDFIKSLGHIPDNMGEACAIATLYYISGYIDVSS